MNMNIFTEFFKWYKSKRRVEKGKELVLKSPLCEEFVQSLIHVVDEHPTTMITIKPLNGGEVIIKSRLTDASTYNEEDLYSVPDIKQEVTIAQAIRGKR